MTVKITLGADPEYGIIDGGRLIPPRDVCTWITEGFGVDGCPSIGELRPAYGTTPHQLVENCEKVLKQGISHNPRLHNLTLKAGGYVVDNPIGGHIHFGHEMLMEDEARMTLNKALNRTLAVLVMMVEDQEEAIDRRVGSPYGSLEDRAWQAQAWGVEYRVLPSWLTHPKEALAILSTAYVIGSECDSPEIMEEAGSLPGYNTQAFRECDKLQLLYHIKPIVSFIQSLPLYGKYEEEIKYLFRMIKNREIWSCKKNMLDTWDLRSSFVAETKKKEASLV